MHRTPQSQSVLSLISGKTIFNNITSQKYTARAVTGIKDGVSCFPGQIRITQTAKSRKANMGVRQGYCYSVRGEHSVRLVRPFGFLPHLQ